MTTERLSMRKIPEILRQKWVLTCSQRQVAASLNVSIGTVAGVLRRATHAGLDWAQVRQPADDLLEARLYGMAPPGGRGRPVPDGAYLHTERKKPGVTLALRFLDSRKRSAAKGEAILPSVDLIKYDEAAADLRLHYKTTGERDFGESEGRLAHLDKFFQGRRLAGIGPVECSAYVAVRQEEGAANGTINQELGVSGRMMRLAYENNKLLRLPIIRKLKPADPRRGFFEREQFEAVKRHLRPDLQVAVSIAYAFGWRMQSEVLTLNLDQVDLGACTLRLAPGTTKNDDGRIVHLTPELHELLQAQVDRVELLSMELGRSVPFLFPYLKGEHKGNRIQEFRKAWKNACTQAMPERLEGEERERREAALKANPHQGLLLSLRHDFRRTAVRNMVNAGVPERVAMKITGHKTRSVFDKYHIVSPTDL